jgi:mono/diheme cytochrome c family protein
VLLVLAVLGLALAGIAVARRVLFQRDQAQTEEGRLSNWQAAGAVYADPGICASCHGEIARTYGRTGMARSFSKLPVETGRVQTSSVRRAKIAPDPCFTRRPAVTTR